MQSKKTELGDEILFGQIWRRVRLEERLAEILSEKVKATKTLVLYILIVWQN